jgi:hypothetical protein
VKAYRAAGPDAHVDPLVDELERAVAELLELAGRAGPAAQPRT